MDTNRELFITQNREKTQLSSPAKYKLGASDRGIVSFVEASAEQHDMTVHPDAAFGLGRRHIRGGNVAEIGNMPQIEAHGLAHEQIERHLVHRLAVGANMPK